jgi:hypothetical protein
MRGERIQADLAGGLANVPGPGLAQTLGGVRVIGSFPGEVAHGMLAYRGKGKPLKIFSPQKL